MKLPAQVVIKRTLTLTREVVRNCTTKTQVMGDNMEGLLTTYEANPSISEAVSNILHSSDLTSLSMLVSQNDGKRNKEQRVKRPMNAFMLYAQVARRKVATKYPNLNYAKLSKTLGKIWQVLPEDERRPFILEAERLRAQHKLKHPGYKYTPRRTKDKKTHGLGKKAQCENLKPEELLNILQTKRDPPMFENSPHYPNAVPTRSGSLGSEDELQPLNSTVYYEDPLMCLLDTPATSESQAAAMRNSMEEEMKAFSCREQRDLSYTGSGYSSGPDLKWVFSGHVSRPGYPNTNNVFDPFCTNPSNLFVSQRQNSAATMNQQLGFFSKQEPCMSGFPSLGNMNHPHGGIDFPQNAPLKHKTVEANGHAFFTDKPHLSNYMTI